MNTDMDELVTYLLFAAAALFLVSAIVAIYASMLLLEVRARIKTLNLQASIERDNEWPKWKGRV